MGELRIKLEDIHPIELLGTNNNKLRIIQKNFPKLKILARGNEILAQGDEEELSSFDDKINQVVQHILRFHQITENALDNMLQNREADAPIAVDEDGFLLIGNQGQVIKAKTENQIRLVESTEKNDIVFAIGSAGTGKTYTSVAIAVRALKRKEVKRIVLTRPAVEAGESLGFLPGDLKEKIDPYLRPLYDALDDMIPPEKLRQYMEHRIIEVAPLAFMRGRTLNNAYVILDEAQNTTPSQLKMFLTRMGPQAKFIITGDLTQIDLPKRQQSGLIDGIRILKNIKGIGIIELDVKDVIRHKLVKDIITAYENNPEPQKPIRERRKPNFTKDESGFLPIPGFADEAEKDESSSEDELLS